MVDGSCSPAWGLHQAGVGAFNAAELVFYRGLIGMAVLWAWRGTGREPGHAPPGMHAWRSLIGVTSVPGSTSSARLPLPRR